MLYKEFSNVIRLLKQCKTVMDGSAMYVRDDLFMYHNELITALLCNVYEKPAVDFVFNQWLCGNRSPVIFTDTDGNTIEQPIDTVRELWRAMECYKK